MKPQTRAEWDFEQLKAALDRMGYAIVPKPVLKHLGTRDTDTSHLK